LGFFKKHRRFFYFLTFMLFAGVIAGFYYMRNDWLLWYYAFPSYIQVSGLLLFIASFLLMRIVDHHLGFKVRIFWSVLKGESYQLATGGLFKIVRHPIYALVPVMIIGALLYTGEWVLLYPLFFNLMTRRWYARREEAYVKQFATGDYETYVKQTQNRFYPKLIWAFCGWLKKGRW